MTLYRVIEYSRQSRGGALTLIELVLRDGNFRKFQGFAQLMVLKLGVIYFAVIFAANVATTVVFLVGPLYYMC